MPYYFKELPPPQTVKAVRRTTLAYFIFGVLWIFACYAAEFILLFFCPALLERTWFSLCFSTAVLYLVAFPVLLILLSRIPATPVTKRKMPLWHFALLLPMMYTLTMAGNLMGQTLSAVLNLFPLFRAENALTEMLFASDSLWIIFLLTVIVAPIMEELVFRKMLMPRLLPLGEGVAVLLSGLFFGLFHGNLYQFFYAFFIGLVLGYLFAKTGKVIYTVFMHMAVNFFSGFLPTLLLQGLGDLENLALNAPTLRSLWLLFQYEICIFALVVGGAVLIALTFRRVRASRIPSAYSIGVQARCAFLNAGTVCFICFWAFMFLFGVLNIEYIRGIL